VKREYGYVVTFWANVPPHGRVWINKDVDWSIDSEEEGMSNRRAVVAEMSKEFGGDLRWVDLETKMGTGAWELVRRFIDPSG
tara:strand:+ start:424 stop:669 length:246 start_codon:yes stop_codon:yes gene_type:complete